MLLYDYTYKRLLRIFTDVYWKNLGCKHSIYPSLPLEIYTEIRNHFWIILPNSKNLGPHYMLSFLDFFWYYRSYMLIIESRFSGPYTSVKKNNNQVRETHIWTQILICLASQTQNTLHLLCELFWIKKVQK